MVQTMAAERNRLTEQAIADIRIADEITLSKGKGGYRVNAHKGDNATRIYDKNGCSVIYKSKDAAKRAIKRHNETAEIRLKSTLE